MVKREAEVVSAEFVAEHRARPSGRPVGTSDPFWDAFLDGKWRAVADAKNLRQHAHRMAKRRDRKAEVHRLDDGRYAVRFVPRETEQLG